DLIDCEAGSFEGFLRRRNRPRPLQVGSTPATAVVRIRASGLFAVPVTRRAAAPSLIPLELAAVTVPSFLNAGLSFATASSVVRERGYSSFSYVYRSGCVTGNRCVVNK